VKDNLLLDFDDVKKKITPRTKAVINVHLFGIYNKAPVLSVPIIGDSCQYLGKTEGELFTAYSFQATKIITTIDGGMLVCKRKSDYMRAKLLRWYGIDRETRQPNIDVRIHEAGYKYHMNDMTALLGIDGLNHLDSLLEHRMKLQNRYKELIGGYGGSPYLIHSLHRNKLITQLARYGIEAGLVHKRNDIHPIFGEKRQDVPTMNRIEHQYIFLPCHNHMTIRDVDYICRRIKEII
jgi:dTDP-4-amino-4,6-dideoxygalactose transaminase